MTTGYAALQGEDPSVVRILRDHLLAQAQRAREDIVSFSDFVLVEERTGERIKTAPHQRVIFEFMRDHDRGIVVAPPEFAKTWCGIARAAFELGQDPSTRGAFVSATQQQAEKPLSVLRGYIENSARLRLVFPRLRPTQRDGEPWSQSKITIDRPRVIRDPSVVAFGADSKGVLGSRLKWVFVDDLLNFENTRTKEQRDSTREWLESTVFSRLDRYGGWVFLLNTAWHPEDVIQKAIQAGWPTLRMTAYGDIYVQDDHLRITRGLPSWDSKELRLRDPYEPNPCRLVAHDPDPENEVPLWPEAGRTVEWIEEKRAKMLPKVFNQQMLGECRDDGSALCKQEFVDRCFEVGRRIGATGFRSRYDGQNPIFVGVDPAFSPGEERDESAFVTFEARPDGINVILDVEGGRWDAPTTLDKIFQRWERYGKNGKLVICVETNGAQLAIKQFALKRNVQVPIRAHHTTDAKAKPGFGIVGIFTEMMNGAWAFPSSNRGEVHPEMQKLVDGCLDFVPEHHTNDRLMAFWLARTQAVKWGAMGRKSGGGQGGGAAALAGRVLRR